MANPRSQYIIRHVLQLAESKDNFTVMPTEEKLDSLVPATEDIIFCWPSTIGWGGLDRMSNRSNGLAMLTRHRLLLVGVAPDSIEAVVPLGNIVAYNAATYALKVDVTPNAATSPLRANKTQSSNKLAWYHLEPADGIAEVLVRQMSALPYILVIQTLEGHKMLDPSMPKYIHLPISPVMRWWNRATIGYEALMEITHWLQSGRPLASQLLNHLAQDEKILFAAICNIQIASKRSVLLQNLSVGFGTRAEPVQKPYTFDSPTYCLVTTQHLFLVSRGRSQLLGLDQVKEVAFSRNILRKSLTVRTLDQVLTMRFSDSNLNSRFFEALMFTGLGSHADIDPGGLTIRELEVLQPFELGDSAPAPAGPGSESDLAESDLAESGLAEAELKEDLSRAGYVYVLINQMFDNNLLKIGKTKRRSELRAEEMYTTGVPGKYIVAYEEHVLDCSVAEAKIHERLARYRINKHREFFRLPLKDAVRVVSEVAREVGIVQD